MTHVALSSQSREYSLVITTKCALLISVNLSMECILKDSFLTPALDLPDTYQSWFIVAHLHLWLCLVRLKREGEDGNTIIKELVTMFWEDARQRMKTVGVSY